MTVLPVELLRYMRVSVADLSKLSWNPIATNMPTQRLSFAAVAVGKKLVVLGGRHANTTVEVSAFAV